MNEPETEYRIVVTKIQRNVPYREREYQKVSDNGKNGEPEYDYVYSDAVHNVETKIFEQTLDNLDIGSVAKYINNGTPN